MSENLSATELRAPRRGGRSVTILVAADILNDCREVDLTKTIINDIVLRDEYGYKKYGQNLETDDGRPTKWDMYQELLDAVQYQRKDIEEGSNDKESLEIYYELINLVFRQRERLESEAETTEAMNWISPEVRRVAEENFRYARESGSVGSANNPRLTKPRQ